MAKKNISASVDEDVEAYLSQEHVNCSGLINKLVKRHMNAGMSGEQIRQFRERQVESEIEMLENQLETKLSELETIKEAHEDKKEKQQDAIDRRLEKLQSVKGQIDESHPTVEALADEYFNGSKQQALEAMRERNEELEHVPERYL